MDAPFTIIDNICKAATSGDMELFLDCVAEDANVFYLDKEYTGKDFGKALISSGAKCVLVDDLQVSKRGITLNHASFYIRTISPDENSEKRRRRYVVDMTWQRMGGKGKIKKAVIAELASNASG